MKKGRPQSQGPSASEAKQPAGSIAKSWLLHGPSVPKAKTRPASKGRVHKGRTRT